MKTVLFSRLLTLTLAAGVAVAAIESHTAQSAEPQAARGRSTLPVALAGGWGFTTISGTTY